MTSVADVLDEQLKEVTKQRDSYLLALKKIRQENHWTTVHQIIDDAVKKGKHE